MCQHERDYYLDINIADFSARVIDNLVKMMKDKIANDFVRNFYVVNSTSSLPPIIDGWMIEDNEYCYGAPITRVHINKNCIDLATAYFDSKDIVANDSLHYVKLT